MDADGRIAETDILFVELDEDGTELSRQTFTVPGDVLLVDAWTVKFDQEQVAQGHPLFGRTLNLDRARSGPPTLRRGRTTASVRPEAATGARNSSRVGSFKVLER